MAPTILWLLHQPVLESMDGRVLTEAFDSDFVASRPVEHRSDDGVGPDLSDLGGFSDDESEAVRERLRGLGYLS